MGLFNTILQKLGFMKDKAVEAVAGETAAGSRSTGPHLRKPPPWKPLPLKPLLPPHRPPLMLQPQRLKPSTSSLSAKPWLQRTRRNSTGEPLLSILMKLLGMDSSLANRKGIAERARLPENLIGGDYSQMNVWLIKAVMKKLAENGGKVPEELK